MTVFFEKKTVKAMNLTELVDYLDSEVDFHDIESIKDCAPAIQGVAVDTNWFIEVVNQEIENNILSDKKFKNHYTSNSTVLGRSKIGKPYFLRTNIWLPESNPLRAGMAKSFFAEDFFHDHSFDLLTVGLLGSGYKTNIRHYDHQNTVGYVGEIVKTHDPRCYTLAAGDALFMEKHNTIHQQMPPSDTSVSFNIMLDNIKFPKSRQYEFDVISEDKFKIKAMHYNGYRFSHSIEYMIAMACNFYDENTKQYLVDLYARLIEQPQAHEPIIILLKNWFKKLGISDNEIKPFDLSTNTHIAHHFESINALG